VNDESIARTPRQLERGRLEKVLRLMRRQAWLQSRDAAVLALHDVCPNDAGFDISLDLLHRFTFFDVASAQREVCEHSSRAIQELELSPKDTLFVALSDADRANSGLVVLNWMKQHLAAAGGWQKDHFYTGVPAAAHAVSEGGSLIFVDDFVGTGDTLRRKAAYIDKVLRRRGVDNVTIGLIALAAMKAAESTIRACAKKIAVRHELLRGISDYYNGTELQLATQAMLDAETMLAKKIGNRRLQSFGYKASETLYAIEGTSTPNNVFPLFWWGKMASGLEYPPILVRA